MKEFSDDFLRRAIRARYDLLEFIRFMWNGRREYTVGRHTREIASRLGRAVRDYRRGKSTYLIIKVPFRHGKSEIVSRNFPVWFLGHNPDSEVMLATYAQSLSNQLSRSARSMIRSDRFAVTFYKEKLELSKESSAVDNWELSGRRGRFQAIGIGGGATGKGADLLIVDDYLKGRSDAESPTVRDAVWDDFSGNLFTRLSPVHIVVILATPWHPDDLIGRILARMDRNSPHYDPEYSSFEVLSYPARNPDGTFLFPERFSAEWYHKMFAVLGSYQSASLLQCEPVSRGGNLFQVQNIRILDSFESVPKHLRWVRFWDLASTERERAKSDPDYTSGCLAGVDSSGGHDVLYVRDVRYCQSEAPERNNLILQTAELDGASVPIGVESVAGYKDTYTTLSSLLRGRRTVRKVEASKDKVIRAQELEPLFEAGHVIFLRGSWNQTVLEQLQSFPSGAHDDHVDSLTGAYRLSKDLSGSSRFIFA